MTAVMRNNTISAVSLCKNELEGTFFGVSFFAYFRFFYYYFFSFIHSGK